MDPHFRRILIIFIILAAFCFSRFSCSIEREKEKTLAIIKPDGVYGNYIDKIKNIIIEYGFSITREMKVHLDEVSVRSFYAEHSSKSFFHSLVKYMTSGPVLVMILEKDNAVVDWRKLIGPTDAEKAKVTHPQSVRALCGIDAERNCVHGSDSIQSASREMSFFLLQMYKKQDMLSCEDHKDKLGVVQGKIQTDISYVCRWTCFAKFVSCSDPTVV